MGRKLLEISYLGTNYCGWQVQPNGITVQQALQDALEKLLKSRPGVTGCSRTDSGVHAKSFFCHFNTDSHLPNKGLVMGLNTILPEDIAALSCTDVSDDFHARYCATGKTYKYTFIKSDVRDPFFAATSFKLKQDFDFSLAGEFCSLICGKHDFAAFSSIHRTVTDTVRQVFDCHIEVKGKFVYFFITADGFLYNMVRIIAGALLDYCRGKITKQTILDAFEVGDRSLIGATLPPYGLCLEKVHYDEFQK